MVMWAVRLVPDAGRISRKYDPEFSFLRDVQKVGTREAEGMLILAIVLISLALVFYTIGVWAERLKKTLTWPHVALFGLGLLFDASGTEVMRRIAAAGNSTMSNAPDGSLAQILSITMAITGLIALILMAVHFFWALIVMIKGTERAKAIFHKFSVTVWAIWLVPYLTGMVSSMVA